jgi:hypothetical protein
MTVVRIVRQTVDMVHTSNSLGYQGTHKAKGSERQLDNKSSKPDIRLARSEMPIPIDPVETFLGTWLAALSALYLRLRDRQTKYEVNQGTLIAGHEAILHEVRALRGVFDRVLEARLIGGRAQTVGDAEPERRRRGNGDD